MHLNASLDFLEMLKNSKDSHPTKKTTQELRGKELQTKPQEVKAKDRKTKEPDTSKTKTNDSKAKEIGSNKLIVVIDTETNWHDEVMSIGVALADADSFKCIDTRYYIIDPEYKVGGIYSNVINYHRKNYGDKDTRNNQTEGVSNELKGAANISAPIGNSEIVCSRSKALNDLVQFLENNNIAQIFAYNAKFDYSHLRELSAFEWYDIMRLAAYKQYNRAITEEMPCCKTGRLKTNYGVEPITRMLSGDSRYCEVHNAVYDAVDELRIIELLGHALDQYSCARIN